MTQIAAWQMVDDYGVDYADAVRQIREQPAQTELSARLGRVAGPAWAGSFIDHRDGGRLQVLVTNSSSVTAAVALDAELAAAHERFTVVQVSRSYADLAQVVDAASAMVAAEGADAGGSFVDVASNAAVIEVRPAVGAPAGERSVPVDVAALTAVTNRVRARVSSVYGDAARVEMHADTIEPAACYSSYQECDGPLRGGVYMPQAPTLHSLPYKNKKMCTAGFVVTGNNTGNPYILTAGHCYEPNLPISNPSNTYLTRMPKDGQEHLVGYLTNRQYGPADIAVVSVVNQWGWFPLFMPMNTVLVRSCPVNDVRCLGHPTTADEAYAITAQGTVGQLTPQYSFLCATGAVSATRCGQYQAAGIDNFGLHNLAKVAMRSCAGDSGGPVYIGHTAYGIVSQTGGWAPGWSPGPDSEFVGLLPIECYDTTYYQGVVGGTLAMQATLRTTP